MYSNSIIFLFSAFICISARHHGAYSEFPYPAAVPPPPPLKTVAAPASLRFTSAPAPLVKPAPTNAAAETSPFVQTVPPAVPAPLLAPPVAAAAAAPVARTVPFPTQTAAAVFPAPLSVGPAVFPASPAQLTAASAVFPAISAPFAAAPLLRAASPVAQVFPFASAPAVPAAVPAAPVSPVVPAVAPVVKLDYADSYPQYQYAYNIQDALTGDSKAQEESRDGGVVRGRYSLIEADGSRRIVDYYADPINGFNAVVQKDVPVPVAHTASLVKAAPALVAA